MNKNNPFSPQGDHELDSKKTAPLLPSKLPEVSTIDILILDGSDALMGPSLDVPHKRIQDRDAQEITDLFRQLPPGNQARCHIPPFGLRFYTEDGLQRACSICWECNNICGDFQYGFDASGSISQSLLALLTRLSK